jgi:hypothetical protein
LGTDLPPQRGSRNLRHSFWRFLLAYLLDFFFLVHDLFSQGFDFSANRQKAWLGQSIRLIQLPCLLAQGKDLVLLLPLQRFQPRLSLAGTPQTIGLESCLSCTLSKLVKKAWHFPPSLWFWAT